MNSLKFWYCLIPVMLLLGCNSLPPASAATPVAMVAVVAPAPPTPIPLPEPILSAAAAVEAAPAPETIIPITVPDPQQGLTWTFYPLPGSYLCDQVNKDSCYETWPETQALVIDREGRIWTAHPDGVRVLAEAGESATWLLYTQAHGLPYDDVQTLAVDQAGQVWAEARGRLAVFNNGAWIPVEVLPGRAVSALAVDMAGQVWAHTGQELVKFDSDRQVQEVIPTGESPDIITAIAIGQAGQVWGSTSSSGLTLFDGTKWASYPAPDNLDWTYMKRLRIDPQGNLWLTYGRCFLDPSSCSSMGLSRFDGQSWSHYLQSAAHLNTAEDMVYDVALDPQGNAWVVTASGIKKFDGQDWTTYQQNPDPGGKVIAIDGAGNKWIGGHKHVFKLSP